MTELKMTHLGGCTVNQRKEHSPTEHPVFSAVWHRQGVFGQDLNRGVGSRPGSLSEPAAARRPRYGVIRSLRAPLLGAWGGMT